MAPVTGLGNYKYDPNTSTDRSNVYSSGGDIVAFTSDTTTLLIGDAVYITSTGTVDKSTTAANYVASAGIVVGGASTGMKVGTLSTDVGTTASTSGLIALVQTSGLAWGVADATVAGGVPVSVGNAGATKGRLEDTTVATAGQIVGTSMQAGSVGVAFLIFIDHR